MICKEIPKTMYCHIGGSGTWGCEFPEDLNMEGITLLKRDMEFETPFGVTACMKLYEMDASITADHKPRQVLYVPFHGWKGLSPYNDTPSERIFWALREAGVKYILADGSGGGINPLLEPGDIICPQDFIDYTKRVSYLGKFTPYSMRMREIICPDLHRILLEKASGVFRRVFRTGIYGVAEAPRFESAAEIQKMYADHCDVCGQTMVPEAALARAIGACYAALYVISNSAEGINPNWERSIFDIYSECAPVVGKVMLEAMAAINPETMNCHCGENIIQMPKAVQNRLDM